MLHQTIDRVALGVAASLLLTVAAGADVVLPSIIGDGMVLQREAEAVIWGWAGPRERVRVVPSWPAGETRAGTGAGTDAEAFADDHGAWSVRVRTPAAGGPFTLTVSGTSTHTIRNVMVGEVWICSGQSNMEMPLANVRPGYTGVLDAEREIATARDASIRLFTVANFASAMPRIDCRGRWAECTPDTVRTFSATGYFFGREIRRCLDVPVGLISADWGGTVAEAWTSADGLRGFPEFASSLAFLDEMIDPSARTGVVRDRMRAWWEALGDGDVNAAWTAVGFDDGAWGRMRLPATMEEHGLGSFDGVVYFRRSFEVPAANAGRAAVLDLGPIDDYDDVWINGVHVGATHAPGSWADARSYAVEPGTLRAGRNVVGVRVLDTGGLGGINGRPEQMQLRPDGAPPIALAGLWRFVAGTPVDRLPRRPAGPDIGPNTPSVLYNGMIAPIVPYAMRGAIWYQGESNRKRAEQYRRLFPAMISDWRAAWGQGDFPFYFVQIAPYGYGGDTGETAALRAAQAEALHVPGTGMAVTLDIGNVADIHPKNKQEVGRRLALWALARTYGVTDLAYSGPSVSSSSVEGNEIHVRFAYAENGLMLRPTSSPQFAIAGRDGIFAPASAQVRGAALVISSPSVPHPVAARYAWDAAPEGALFNGAGLPAAPFRTDDLVSGDR